MSRAADTSVTTRQRLLVATATALVSLPHVSHLPLWLSLLAGALFAWQIVAARRNAARLVLPLRLALILAVIAVVVLGWGRINGLQAGSALLVLMLALKLSEVQQQRDATVAILLGYFVIVTQCMFSQSLAMIVYLVAGCTALTAVLVALNCGPDPLPLRALAKTAARLLLQALPIAVVLFVLFPRIPGPLWSLPSNSGTVGITGLSDHMQPGSITRLVRSDAVVLRAHFQGAAPAPDALYWRGPVLWHYADGVWSIGAAAKQWPAPTMRLQPDDVQSTRIILEPSSSDWLIAPDVPIRSTAPARMTAGATLVATQSVVGARMYYVRSTRNGIVQPRLPSIMRRHATALPTDGNPRARALAAQWRQSNSSARAIVDQALALFHERPFKYTLTPPPVGHANRIDHFLFDTQAGFCAHYAGAFTFLMRAAGLPARVVTGYLGGDPGMLGDYWIVRSADAHAWSEVWIDGAGWVRVDPTAAIAPERVESGVAAALADDSMLPFMARANGGAWYHVEMLWDGINAGWNRWFLAYGPALQGRMFGLLGLDGWRHAIWALTALVIGLLALVSVWLGWQTRRLAVTDGVQRAWLRLCHKLARRGFERAPHEGPRDYILRVAAARPDWAPALQQLADDYIALRYANHTSTGTRRRFLHTAASFRPRR